MGVAIAIGFGAFNQAVAASIQRLNAFSNQNCPNQCPNKAVLQPDQADRFTFTMTFNQATQKWDCDIGLRITRRVLCAVAGPGGGGGGGGKKGKPPKRRRAKSGR
jgi:hypothetical protein